MAELFTRLNVLQALLRAPLQISEVKSRLFPEGWKTPDEVIVTHRFIILQAGAMEYTVEGVKRRLDAGVQIFVPAWCRREWRVPRKTGGCRLMWCEFSSGAATIPSMLFWKTLEKAKIEETAFGALRRLEKSDDPRVVGLSREGELKACLARFWTAAQTAETRLPARGVRVMHAEVARSVTWLERHFAEADALEAFYRTLTLSPNHFRLLFRRETGETVQATLARLRMRRARYLVQETALPMKRIAADTGFSDALYFSSQYKKFWGRAATEDRRAGGVA